MSEETTYSLSELAKLCALDRATVKKRLEGVEPQPGAKGAKLYTLKQAVPALVNNDDELDRERLRKTTAEADRLELQLRRDRGEVLPVKEVRDYLQDLFKRLQQRTVVQMPTAISQQLYKAESAGQINDILQRELGRIFNELRSDHKSFQ